MIVTSRPPKKKKDERKDSHVSSLNALHELQSSASIFSFEKKKSQMGL